MWIEKKYIVLLGASLKLFKSVGQNTWNFRCPICHDSTKSSSKARGYILFGKGKFYSYCHNCHASLPFYAFLEKINPFLHADYLREKYAENPRQGPVETVPPVIKKASTENTILLKLTKISRLKPNHPAKKFVMRRLIPAYWHSRLYYAPNFNKFANLLVDDKFDPKKGEPRLVIPMLDARKRLIGVQGRAIEPIEDRFRYMTCLIAPENARFVGLDLVNYGRPYYVFEGPIDAMFIDNSIAVCGGAIHSELKKHDISKKNCVVVYDNEPRNKDIVKNMLKVARRGYKICVWPEQIEQKDINDMVCARVGTFPNDVMITETVRNVAEYIKEVIDKNTFEGLAAESRIMEWSRV